MVMIQLIKFLSLRICGEADSKFIDDDPNQSIQIKGFDLDFDTLTWTLIGMRSGQMELYWQLMELWKVVRPEIQLEMHHLHFLLQEF